MDVVCTLNLGDIIDFGCGLLHPHRALSLRFLLTELIAVVTETRSRSSERSIAQTWRILGTSHAMTLANIAKFTE